MVDNMTNQLIKVIIVASIFGTLFCEECPTESIVEPCICSKEFDRLTIECNEVDLKEVASIFQKIEESVEEVENVFISNGNSTELNTLIFSELAVKNVWLDLPKLEYFSDSIFEGQEESIERMIIESSNLAEVPLLPYLYKMREYVFTDDESLTELKQMSFKGMQNSETIEEIRITNTGLKSIEEYTFEELLDLRRLVLSNNSLSSVNGDMLPWPPAKLQLFDVSGNSLEKLPKEVLEHLPEGAKIDLSYNQITKVSDEELDLILHKQYTLDLRGNNIECDCPWVMIALSNSGQRSKILGKCSGPQNLADRSFDLLEPELFPNCNYF